MKKLFLLLLIVIGGGAGGLLLQWGAAKWWPEAPFLAQNQTVIVNRTEQVILGEKETLERAYRKVLPTVVPVSSLSGNAVIASGFGFVVSADGLVLTRRETVGTGAPRVVIRWESQEIPARIVRTAEDTGLVLLQADISNAPVVSFADDTSERMGTAVFLAGTKGGRSGSVPFVNMGSIKSIDGSLIETTIREEFRQATGTPLVGFDGNVIGINAVNSSGYVFAVSADAIRKFIQ